MSPFIEPFNELKYKSLMDGLECTEINKSFILSDNEEFRMDSEYYEKQYLSIYNTLKNGELFSKIFSMHDVSSNGSFKYVQNILKDGFEKTVPYIRSGNVGFTFLNLQDLTTISKEAHQKLPLSQTKLHDIMMARKGKIGGATIITENEVNYNCNENVIKLSVNDPESWNPFYVTSFLNSKFGMKQLERVSTGNVQPWVSIYQIRKMRIPKLSKKFQLRIENMIRFSHEKKMDSVNYYNEANELLLTKLKLNNFKPSTESISIKLLSESFIENGRLDSEYYQPKFDDLFNSIKTFSCKKLKDLVIIKKSIEPGSQFYCDDGIPFVRIADMNKFGISKPKIKISSDAVKDISSLYLRKGTILLTKDGSVGIAYKVDSDKKYITSGAILHLNIINENEILPDYLTLVLNSQVVKLQSERDVSGAIIRHWKPSDIGKISIPLLDMSVQQQIADKVKHSFLLMKRSDEIICEANSFVEKAIENGETEVEDLLNSWEMSNYYDL